MIENRGLQYILYFTALVVIGSTGFYIIEGENWSIIDSIYMTIITISTVGFGEVHVLSQYGKIWAIIVIIFGVGGFASIIYELGNELIQLKNYRSRTMRNKISKLEQHYIICGYGRMGAVIATELHKKHIPFVIIDINDTKIAKIEEMNYIYIHDDATMDNTLIDAGIKYCEGIVVVLDNDQDNLFVTMSARNLNNEAYIISRCAVRETGNKLTRAGANKVVNPYTTGGHRMSELLIKPYVDDTVTIESLENITIDYSLEEFSIEKIDSIKNKTVSKSNIRKDYGLLVVGIVDKDGNTILNPGPNELLKPDSKVILIGSSDQLSLFEEKAINDL